MNEAIDKLQNELRTEKDEAIVNAPGFTGGTLVWSERGLQEIEYIAVGEKVLSRCELTGEVAYKPVVRTMLSDDVDIYFLWYVKNNGHLDCVKPTANHPFWVEQKGWTLAISLQEGDRLLLQDGKYVSVLEFEQKYQTSVHNIEVEDFRTYFVGEKGLWVHNDCSGYKKT